MPLFDLRCRRCGIIGEQFVRLGIPSPCRACGGATDKIWTRPPAMIRDSIRGGVVVENLTPHPKRFYSKTEIRDEMRARGVESRVKHVGLPGSDRSPHTTRWI